MLMQTFRAKIYKVGINPCIDVPAAVSRNFGVRGYMPIRGRLGDWSFQATLVPVGAGRHRLFLNGPMRDGAGLKVGDTAELRIERDPNPRPITLPNELAEALPGKARQAFDQLLPSRQKELIAYFSSLKKPESRKQAIRKIRALFS